MRMLPQPVHPGLLRISVVVPTFHRLQLLRRCLEALLAQDFDPRAYEIVVVDDGHDDDVRTAVLAIATVVQMPAIRYVRPPHGRGPACARNAGWHAAHAPIVAFTDDDTIPEPSWLAEGEAAMTDIRSGPPSRDKSSCRSMSNARRAITSAWCRGWRRPSSSPRTRS